ncbi:MAG: hypothetical protein GY844_24435 [Bradyrhizobium sp.]|nr:hypothetical protein [Bradyrhizobium sp.]
MKTCAAKFMVALIASILSSASAFAAPGEAEQRPDTCLTSPREYSPPGSRWRYRIERGSGRHCWFLKDDVEKAASKSAEPKTAAEEPAPAPSPKKPAKARTVSDARAEFSQVPVEPEARPEPAQNASAAAASTAVADNSQPSTARSANMLAPAAASRWPDPMSTANSVASPPAPPAAPADQSAEARNPPAATPPAKPQAMPRAVPPMPLSEKPMSLPMLITVIAGGLSVFAVLVSMFFAWRSSRAARLSPSAPMPPLEMPDQQVRPGDLYRERQRLRAQQRGAPRAA